MQPILFLSDAHLGGFSPERNHRIERQLISLLDYCQERKIRLCVLGDLFDYWMEYPQRIPELGHDLNKRFARYNRKLGPTLYITGNHDNWTRGYFEEIGFRVEGDMETMKLGSGNALLMHGDGIPNEQQRLIRPPMHRLLRNQTFISWFQRLLPPALGLKAMKWFSRFNRLFAEWSLDPTPLNSWARNALRDSDLQFAICGHDHIPRKIEFPFGTYLNLGTFYEHRTLGFYNNNELQIVVWTGEELVMNDTFKTAYIDE